MLVKMSKVGLSLSKSRSLWKHSRLLSKKAVKIVRVCLRLLFKWNETLKVKESATRHFRTSLLLLRREWKLLMLFQTIRRENLNFSRRSNICGNKMKSRFS